jgi:hypothetical protein
MEQLHAKLTELAFLCSQVIPQASNRQSAFCLSLWKTLLGVKSIELDSHENWKESGWAAARHGTCQFSESSVTRKHSKPDN